jgi:hypothetical protein
VCEFIGCQDVRIFREEALDQTAMELRLQIRAALRDDCEAVISIQRIEQRGEHDTTCSDAEQHERFDLIGAENHVKIRSGKCADAMLCHDDVPRFGSKGRVDLAGCALEQLLMLGGRFENRQQLVPSIHLRQASSESNLHVNDGDPRVACSVQDAGSSVDERLWWLCVNRYDAALTIQSEDRAFTDLE